MKFGYIGVGALSTPMLENMLDDGHDITVWNRTRSAGEPLAGKGASVVDHAIQTADSGGIVVSCLSDDHALSAVFGDGEIFRALGEGGVHVSMSTCSPQITRRLSDAISAVGGHHLSCPVMGRPDFVARRGHRYCVSGDPAVFERFKPVLESISENIFYLGREIEAAPVAKLCTNFLIASAVESMAESLALAVGSGVDARAIRSMWNQTYFPGLVHEIYSQQMLDQTFDPLFAMNLMLKDIGLFSEAADEAGIDVPIADQLKSRFRSGMHEGHGELDFTAIAKLAFRQAQSNS